MKFVADAMLGRLAKLLRLLGADVAYDPSADDNEVIRRSLAEGRAILTRDAGLASRPLASNCILITSEHIDKQIAQAREAYPDLDREHPLTRCSTCNGQLAVASREEVRDLVPEHVFRIVHAFHRCKECGKVYWKGSHMRRMRVRLKRKQ